MASPRTSCYRPYTKGTGIVPANPAPGCSIKDELEGHEDNCGVELPPPNFPGNSNPEFAVMPMYLLSALWITSCFYVTSPVERRVQS